jgi:hypothetical protein
MAGEIENEDEVLELGNEPEETVAAADGNDTVAADDDDIEIPTFGDPGDEEPSDTDLVKHLRNQVRERDRRLAEAEKAKQPEPEIVIGTKPTLESCEYDEERFEQELDAFKERQRAAEQRTNTRSEQQRQADQEWEAEKAAYAKKRAALPFKDVEDVESTVAATLNPAQLAMIVKTANDGPKLIYALGKNPAKLATLASITDPVKFIAASVRLEAEVKMAKRKPVAQPDTPVRGSAPLAKAPDDKQEAKLLAEAQRSGNMTPYREYMRNKRKKAA